MRNAKNGYRRLKSRWLSAGVVAASLPVDGFVGRAAKEEPGEEWDTEDGYRCVGCREVGADGAGEGDVLQDLFADQAVAAEVEVDVAADEQELAVGGGERRSGVANLFGRVDGGEL